jgi:hypothetical protein
LPPTRLCASRSRLFTPQCRFFPRDSRLYLTPTRFYGGKNLEDAPQNLPDVAHLSTINTFLAAQPDSAGFWRN